MNKTNSPLSKSYISLQSKLSKELRTLDPQGASDRAFKANLSNMDQSINNMKAFQHKYNLERQKLSKGLHSPIKLKKDSPIPKIPAKFLKLDFKRSSPSKRGETERSPQKTPILHKRLNQIITSCTKLHNENKSALKLLPDIARETTQKYENFSNIVNYLTSSTLGKNIKDYEEYEDLTQRTQKIISDPIKSQKVLRRPSPLLICKNNMLK